MEVVWRNNYSVAIWLSERADMEKPARNRNSKHTIQPLVNKLPRKLQSGVIYHPVHGYPIPPPGIVT